MSIHSDDCVILTDDDVITDAPASTMSVRAGSGRFPSTSFLIHESQLALHHSIYKVFKDKLSSLINEWKRSDNVEYIARGNLRPPSVETVCNWERTAWRETPTSVVLNSIQTTRFHQSPSRWFIWMLKLAELNVTAGVENVQQQ
ncbi:hypothetical protein L914_21376 [Phytophthora nicotianae]|uniref:Uncharacterized protein n=1 Tax=Phytophthora nicotianae TaxID=4792 RepID=W2M3H5_PHYNI|nr:hypothetical protein L914_21376 [Phytophthora nicotianae]